MNKELLGDHPLVASQLNNMGMLYSQQEKNNKAIKYLKESLRIQLSINGENSESTALCYNNIGYVYILLKKNNKALKSLSTALLIYKKNKKMHNILKKF